VPRAVIPHLIAAGGGSLILTSSTCGLRPARGLIDYTAAKHGVVGLAKALALELGPMWVRVNAVCPATVFSPMVNNQAVLDLFSGGPGGSAAKAAFPARAQMMLPIPWMEPEAISEAMIYLASDESKYVTGTAFLVDGGETATPSGIPPIVSTRLAEMGVELS
jgi:(+)-trans-carveol dehydrogenase